MIKEKLDEYLEFDSNLLFNRTPIQDEYDYSIKVKRLVRVFGGAIRDIIAGQPINDIDILVGSQSSKLLEFTLKEQGYTYMDSLIPKDLSSIYKDIKIINEPRTWMKGTKIVQLIRPVNRRANTYKEGFINLIQNVDISCCGVSWDGKKLYENYPDAIAHCQSLVFNVNEKANMFSINRTYMRCCKLEDRGWSNLNKINTISISRDLRIHSLLNGNIDFKSEIMPLSSYKSTLYDDTLPF